MKNLVKQIQYQFDKMCQTGKLFRSNITGNELWDLYLLSFPIGYDQVFRDPNSSEHNCNLCKNFIRRYGNIVALDKDYNIMTIWDVEEPGEEYYTSVKALSKLIKSSNIQDVFVESYDMLDRNLNYESCKKDQLIFKLGVSHNTKKYTKEEAEKFGVVKPNETITFNHLSLNILTVFIDKSNNSVESIMSNFKSSKEVFKRGLDEISLDTLELVKDLINQGSLLDGATHLYKINSFIEYKKLYDRLDSHKKDNWAWVNSYKLVTAKFKNELIGVLCSDISSGIDLNTACQLWNKRVDPVNYMKTTAPITQKQINEAKKFIVDNGYESSFIRRCATIDDIKVSEILHINSSRRSSPISILDSVKPTNTQKTLNFDKVEEVPIDKFMSEILPSCQSVEAYLYNNLKNNFVTLTTAEDKDSKPIFKWSNNYSWTFNGNIAGKSEIKEQVKSAGGFVDAFFRFSIMWNEDGKSIVDLDAHAYTPKYHIYYRDKGDKNIGQLDIDMVNPSKIGVENIFWNKEAVVDGKYTLCIDNYNGRYTSGAKAEIEFNGEKFNYFINHDFKDEITIAELVIRNGGIDKITHSKYLTESQSISQNIYNLDTNNFHKVNLICLSPNHWNDSIGNKFYFFMLDNCKAPEEIRSFHNENLNADLTQHKRIMEILGNTTKVKSTDNQLSGLGFNATVASELIVKLTGTFNRVLKIKF